VVEIRGFVALAATFVRLAVELVARFAVAVFLTVVARLAVVVAADTTTGLDARPATSQPINEHHATSREAKRVEAIGIEFPQPPRALI